MTRPLLEHGHHPPTKEHTLSRIGILFGSSTGNTRRIAKMIKKRYDDATMAEALNVNKATPELVASYDYLILGTPTLGEGEFCGLVLDQDNRKQLSDDRLETWLRLIAGEFGL